VARLCENKRLEARDKIKPRDSGLEPRNRVIGGVGNYYSVPIKKARGPFLISYRLLFGFLRFNFFELHHLQITGRFNPAILKQVV